MWIFAKAEILIDWHTHGYETYKYWEYLTDWRELFYWFFVWNPLSTSKQFNETRYLQYIYVHLQIFAII